MIPKIMSPSFLESTFEPTQTAKSCNGRVKDHKFLSLDNLRSPGMIYFYSKHNLFLRHFCSLARHVWTRLMVEWTIKWLFFSKVCPKVASYGQTEKKFLVGVTGEEIFQFNWRIGRKSNKLQVSLGATLGLQRLKTWIVKGLNIINFKV